MPLTKTQMIENIQQLNAEIANMAEQHDEEEVQEIQNDLIEVITSRGLDADDLGLPHIP